MQLTLIIAAVSAALSGTAGFALAWQLQAGNITEKALDHANTRIASDRASRIALERATSAIAVAQSNSAARAVVLRARNVATGNAGHGLRIASTSAVRTVADDPDACNSVIAAYDSVVDSSSRFIEAVSSDADQCHSDIQLITDSWPK